MIDNDKIKGIIEHFKSRGDKVRVRDVAYTLLSEMFADRKTAYQCLFGLEGYDEYASDPLRTSVEDYMRSEGYIKSISTGADTVGITFEENKREMEQLLVKTQSAMEEGKVDAKDGLKLIADIRVKLNDKFKMERQQQERQIVVEKKFDFVCPHTRRECYQLDKEEAMRRFNLTEKPTTEQ